MAKKPAPPAAAKSAPKLSADDVLDYTIGGSGPNQAAHYGPGNSNAAKASAIKPTPMADPAIARGAAETARLEADCKKLTPDVYGSAPQPSDQGDTTIYDVS